MHLLPAYVIVNLTVLLLIGSLRVINGKASECSLSSSISGQPPRSRAELPAARPSSQAESWSSVALTIDVAIVMTA